MPEVEIDEVIRKLSARDDGGASRQFIEMFSRVVRTFLDYKKWVEMMIEKNGQYQGYGRDQIVPGFIECINLIEDISKNGIKNPIEQVPDHCGYEIDGYHRLIIWKELGHRSVEIVT